MPVQQVVETQRGYGQRLVAAAVLLACLYLASSLVMTVVVTIALMFWGWLWGGMGLILAVPITAGIKAVCDNVQEWRPYGRLMAD